MIYKLEFNKIIEFNNSNWISNRALIDIHKVLNNNLLLHKYKINRNINKKYQVNNHTKINFNKIKEDSVLILDLDIYLNNIEMIREIIEWSIDNNKDLFIPTTNDYNDKFRYDISNIVREYDGETFNINNDSLKKIKRDLLIKSIFL
jgi:hypothetical protein